MASTDIAVIETGTYLALNHSIGELREIIDDNLGGDDVGEFDLPRVIIPPGGGMRWTIPGAFGEESEPDLTGVLILARRTRAYWPDPDPTGEPPQCRSLDARTGIGDPGGDCKACPFAQYGSHVKDDSNAQACSEKEIWFLLREGSFLPTVLALPATSLKGAKQYRVNLASGGVRITDVVTTVSLRAEQGPSGKYGIAVPKVAARLEQKDADAARQFADLVRPILERAAAAANAEPNIPAEPAAEAA